MHFQRMFLGYLHYNFWLQEYGLGIIFIVLLVEILKIKVYGLNKEINYITHCGAEKDLTGDSIYHVCLIFKPKL